MIKYYTDAHIPKSVVKQLRERRVDIIRCEEVGLKDADDPEHLQYAIQEQRILVTGDDDFLSLTNSIEDFHFGIFYVVPDLRHYPEALIGVLVETLFFYHEAVKGGAATLEQDVYNQIIFISRK